MKLSKRSLTYALALILLGVGTMWLIAHTWVLYHDIVNAKQLEGRQTRSIEAKTVAEYWIGNRSGSGVIAREYCFEIQAASYCRWTKYGDSASSNVVRFDVHDPSVNVPQDVIDNLSDYVWQVPMSVGILLVLYTVVILELRSRVMRRSMQRKKADANKS